MTPLARAIGIRSLHVGALEAGDFATAYALLLALRCALNAPCHVEKVAYLLWLEAETKPTAAIPIETSTRAAGDDAS